MLIDDIKEHYPDDWEEIRELVWVDRPEVAS